MALGQQLGCQAAAKPWQNFGHPLGSESEESATLVLPGCQLVEHMLDDKSRGEEEHNQHVRQRGFIGSYFVSGFYQLHVIQNLNVAPGDFSCDV